MDPLLLLPALHLVGGQAVQITRGAETPSQPLGDAVALARRWADEGVQWLHVIDVDAAFGHGDNASLVQAIVDSVPAHVQVAGGIRDDASLVRALNSGAARVTLGTAALADPDWCRAAIKHAGDRLAVGLDVDSDALRANGWPPDENVLTAVTMLDEAGAQHYVVRCTAADGTKSGPSYELLGAICARTQGGVMAMGGISNLEDLRRLRGLVPIGVEGVIVATALHDGSISVPEALRITAGERPVTPEHD